MPNPKPMTQYRKKPVVIEAEDEIVSEIMELNSEYKNQLRQCYETGTRMPT